MNVIHKTHTARELVASAHLFAASLTDLLEEKLVGEVSNRRLSFSQIQALQLLHATARNSVTDIATYLGVSNAAASKSVDRLARGKWLRRSECSGDRRSTRLSLTVAGRRVLAAYNSARQREFQKLFRDIPPGDIEQVSRVLQTLSQRMCEPPSSIDGECSGCEVFFSERCLLRASSDRRCTHNRLNSPVRTPRKTVVIKERKQVHSPALHAAEAR